MLVTERIRTYERGDEEAQVAVYNLAASNLPAFKPAKTEEQARRVRAPGFRPDSRLYFTVHGRMVGYISGHEDGRISYPWTLPGYENCREPLLEAMLGQLWRRGVTKVYAAYRSDWEGVLGFLQKHRFRKTREMLNYKQHLSDLPTTVLRRGLNVTPIRKEDLPDLEKRVPNLLRLSGAELEKYLFNNPCFSAESLFVMRKVDGTPMGYGMLIHDDQFDDVNRLDASMPCFRLGAFGTEATSAKRVNALFSFVVEATKDANSIGMDLMWFATRRLDDSDIETMAAQVPSDVPHLVGFYENYFRRQGGFPVLELDLNG